LKDNIKDLFKIKDIFSKLFPENFLEIHNIIKSTQKNKPKMNMMIKKLSRKQIVIPIEINNAEQIIAKANSHISNINRILKEIKSEILVNSIVTNLRP